MHAFGLLSAAEVAAVLRFDHPCSLKAGQIDTDVADYPKAPFARGSTLMPSLILGGFERRIDDAEESRGVGLVETRGLAVVQQ